MNKLKQKLSFFLFSIIMVLSITMTPLAWDYSFFEDKTVTAATNYETAQYYPVVGIKNVTTEGKLIVTFRQRLANGTYGGNVGEIKNVSKYTTGLVFKHTLNANYHKLSITGRETLNIDINYVRLVV